MRRENRNGVTNSVNWIQYDGDFFEVLEIDLIAGIERDGDFPREHEREREERRVTAIVVVERKRNSMGSGSVFIRI